MFSHSAHDQPYSLTAETVEDSEFALVDRRSLMHLLDHRNDLLVQMVDILADEVRRNAKAGGRVS